MSCLYSKLILNRKYLPNKKNGGFPPVLKDKRLMYVPAECGVCYECRKKRRREWMIRLSEELRNGNIPLFVTLTIDDENLKRVKGSENTQAGQFVRWFLENVRSKTKKSVKHFLVTELGETNGRIHMHGFIWANKELIKEKWIYGFVHIGTFVNEKSINYMTKYMLKKSIDKEFIPKVFASKGIGRDYLKRKDAKNNTYKENGTNETYRFRNGSKSYLPKYYRNKIYTEEEREKLWIEKEEKGEIYICGEKTRPNTEEYNNLLEYHRKRTQRDFGDNEQEFEEKKQRARRERLERYLRRCTSGSSKRGKSN